MREKLKNYLRAGFAGLYVVTFEEIRAEADIKAVADELHYTLLSWTVSDGILNTTGAGQVQNVTDPVEAVTALNDMPEKTVLVLKDYHQFLGDSMQPASPLVTRTLKDGLRQARCNAKAIVILGCKLMLPPELEKEFAIIEMDLPNRDALATVARNIAESAGIETDDATIDAAAEAARGLTTTEAEDIMALSIVSNRTHDPVLIAREKAQTVKKNGILEIIEPKETVADIGGLDNLKTWLQKRRNAFTQQAVEFGLPTPKGVLILGIPGTGKSLTAKAASSILERPILKLDAGKLFAGIVGESEANLRRAIQTAEAIAPAILWIDEIEKGMSGSRSSGSTDGGTSARVFGSFISWMQEKVSPVFVVATANDVSQLPPELLRKGRFDELFFVDLPDEEEREAIWRIHIKKRDRAPDNFDAQAFVKLTDGFTGSEIEQTVIDSLFDSFDAGHDLDTPTILRTVERTVPLSVTMSEQINAMRQWAKNRARVAGKLRPVSYASGRKLAA
jgi:ATP-dependent 26S proteasome regulatory subunit